MRRLALLALCAALGACASARVALLSAEEPGGAAGAVAVMDPVSEAERGQLTEANTEAGLGGGSIRPRPLRANYDALLAGIPPPPQVFVLYFIEGSAKLTPDSAATLEALRRAVTPTADVQLTGHTDTTGDAARNDQLSLDRAAEVRTILVRAGLPVENARVTGRGERELRVPTDDGVSEATNRRVEVIVR